MREMEVVDPPSPENVVNGSGTKAYSFLRGKILINMAEKLSFIKIFIMLLKG